jgi:N-acetylmuramoyl-L-alanine amidase
LNSWPINKTDYISPNYSIRRTPIDSIILHHTAGSFPGCAEWLCDLKSHVSAHLLINKAGNCYQLVDFDKRAWHAGSGAFDVNLDGVISPVEKMWNDRSIGIELEAIGGDGYKYSSIQIHAVERIVQSLVEIYAIDPDHILGHKEIAPGRKVDPENFNMDQFRQFIGGQITSWNHLA